MAIVIDDRFKNQIGTRQSKVNPNVTEYYRVDTGEGFATPEALFRYASSLGQGPITSFEQINKPTNYTAPPPISGSYSEMIGTRPSKVNPSVTEYYRKDTGEGFATPKDLFEYAGVSSFEDLARPAQARREVAESADNLYGVDLNALLSSINKPFDYGAEAKRLTEALRGQFGDPRERITPVREDTEKRYEEARKRAIDEIKGNLASRGLLASGVTDKEITEAERGFAEDLTRSINELTLGATEREEASVLDLLAQAANAKRSQQNQVLSLIPNLINLNRPEIRSSIEVDADRNLVLVTTITDPKTGETRVQKQTIGMKAPVSKGGGDGSIDASTSDIRDLILQTKRANPNIPWFDLWGQIADYLRLQGLNPDNYDKVFWEILHPEGLRGYEKYVNDIEEEEELY